MRETQLSEVMTTSGLGPNSLRLCQRLLKKKKKEPGGRHTQTQAEKDGE